MICSFAALRYNNIQFDSRKEAARYQELILLARAGIITHLELQPRYNLIVNGYKLGFYKADFRYEVSATGEVIVKDVKGVRTAVYQLKKKLVKVLYGVEIIEIGGLPVWRSVKRRVY